MRQLSNGSPSSSVTMRTAGYARSTKRDRKGSIGIDFNRDIMILLSEFFFILSLYCAPLRLYGFVFRGINLSFFRLFGILMICCCCLSKNYKFAWKSFSLFSIVGISITQILYSPNFRNSNCVAIIFGFTWMAFAYSLVEENSYLKKEIVSIIPKTGLLPLALGLYQQVTATSTGRVAPLPFSALVISEGKTGLTFNVYSRITASFGDPSYFASYLALLFGFILGSIICAKELGISRRGVVARFALLLLCVAETFMTLSISGIVGIIAAVVLALILCSTDSNAAKRIVMTIPLLIISLGLLLMLLRPDLLNNIIFKYRNSAQDVSNLYGRKSYIYNAVDHFFMSPLLGTGFGSLSIGGSFSSAHSSFLTVLAQQGAIVFILHFYIIIVCPLSNLGSFYEGFDKSFARISIVALFSIIAQTFAYDTLYSSNIGYVAILMGLISGLTSSMDVDKRVSFRSLCWKDNCIDVQQASSSYSCSI